MTSAFNLEEFKDYEIVGECPIANQGKWKTPVITTNWIEKRDHKYCDLDPKGNVSGGNNGGRYCLQLQDKLVELREGDRVIVFRPMDLNGGLNENRYN